MNHLLLNSKHINPNDLPDIPLPVLDSSLVIPQEKQVKDLKEEVTNNYNIAMQEARISETSILEYNKAVKSWLIALEDLLDIYQIIYDHTLELTREVIQGRTSPYLLSSQGLEDMTKYINKRYTNAMFPTPTITPETIRRLIVTEITKTGSTLGICQNFHSTNHYLLYRMYPVPVPNGDGRSNYISTPNDYILVRNGDYNHTFLNDEGLKDCTKLDEQWYCKNPTIFLTDSCEVHLLMDPGRLNINNLQYEGKIAQHY